MKTVIAIIILALLGWGVYALVKDDDVVAVPEPVINQEENNNTPAATSTQLVTKEFTVRGKNFTFTPAAMTVNKGDKVKITFINEAGTHDLVVEGYNVRTKTLQGGASETIEFVVDKAGAFEYYCSVGSHRAMGMKGTLAVVE